MSSLGTTYLFGARAILKTLAARDNLNLTAPKPANTLNTAFRDMAEANFLIGAVAFWEALSSFHLDQDLATVDYLQHFCQQIELEDLPPNPWTGANTELFLLVAKVGTLTRQRRRLDRLAISRSSTSNKSEWMERLLKLAAELEHQIQSYQIRPTGRCRDTGDKATPAAHFDIVARIYQLTTLLELYQGFPDLLLAKNSDHAHRRESNLIPFAGYREFLVELAINVVGFLSRIPPTSGTKAVQLLPLVIAGSALQYHESIASSDLPLNRPVAIHSLASMANHKSCILHWRSFVREAMSTVHRYVGIDSAERGIKIVEQVWRRADMKAKSLPSGHGGAEAGFVHWAEVMSSENLETLLG